MNFAEVLGWAVYLLAHAGRYRNFPLVCVEQWLVPAARLRQLHLITEPDGRLIGYLTWARFTPDAEQRWICDPDVTLHLSEWNEGDRLWVLDFVAVHGYARRCIALAKELFPECQELRFLRRNEDGRTHHVSRWRRVTMRSGVWRRVSHDLRPNNVSNVA